MRHTPIARTAARLVTLAGTFYVAACADPSTATPDLEASLARNGGGGSSATSTANSIALSLNGLPAGALAGVRVSGSNGYSATVNASQTLSGLANATYSVSASNVVVNGTTYTPSPASQSTNLKNGTTRSLSVAYTAQATTGTLAVSVSVPSGGTANVTITGPNAFSQAIAGSQSFAGLAPGAYTVTAAATTSNGITYTPSPATQTVNVTAGATATAGVSYTASGVVSTGDFNVVVLGMTLTQAVQKLDNSITLIAGRDAMLRVFPVATAANTVKPSVRVLVFQSGVQVGTLTATSSGTSVPTALNEGNAAASWNVRIPATWVRAGLGLVAEVDPENAVTESSKADNRFPAAGLQTFNVRTVTPLNVTFVPVTQASNGRTGRVNVAYGDSLLRDTREMLPTGAVSYTVRAPYTTSQTLLSDGAGWSATLSEVYTLRTTDNSSNQYYGVISAGYGSGVAGVGYIGAPASIGWDAWPSATNVMAHELGHNFGRRHAPCGGVSSYDTSYPYSGGQIGVFGYNLRTNAVIQNTAADLMGYCSPSWISDYTFNAMLSFRGFTTAAMGMTTSSATEQPGLLVWGRVEPNGDVVLEPAMRITARSVLPAAAGDFTMRATDESGATLFTYAFAPLAVADEADDKGSHFAFVVPMSDAAYERLAQLEVSGRGRRAERTSRVPAQALEAAAKGLEIAAEASSRARLKWNASSFPMVMVRDAATGQVLSFARGGDAGVFTDRADLEVIVSDGLRSASAAHRVRGR